jgi:hypothetical protein
MQIIMRSQEFHNIIKFLPTVTVCSAHIRMWPMIPGAVNSLMPKNILKSLYIYTLQTLVDHINPNMGYLSCTHF